MTFGKKRRICGLAAPGQLVIACVLTLAGCSSGSAAVQPLVGDPTLEVTPTPTLVLPTALATEPDLTQIPATEIPTTEPPVSIAPTAKPANFYTPPGWDGSSDVNCPAFDTHAHAVSFFKGTGGTTTNDPYGLDRDHDGNPCETLP